MSIRWQPLDPKYIGAITLRASYSEAFHAPTLAELAPAGSQNFPLVTDPHTATNPPEFRTDPQVEERISGNPNCIRKLPMNGPTERFTARNGLRA